MTTTAGCPDGDSELDDGPTWAASGPDALAWTGWMAGAACRGAGAEEFFGPAARGARWCGRCPVVDCCFWWAVVAESEAGWCFGIWGGATPAVRAKVVSVVGVAWARDRLAEAVARWAGPAARGGTERRAG